MEKLTTGISPRALRLTCIHPKRQKVALPRGSFPSAILGDAAALILVARQELGVLGDGGSAEGSTVQLRVLLAARGPLLWLVGAVRDVGLAGALPVGRREAGRQPQALVLAARLLP